MKLIPAPKLMHDKPVGKNGYRAPSIRIVNDRAPQREPVNSPEKYPEPQDVRYAENPNERYPERLNDRYPDRQNERLPEREYERLPERQPERQLERQPERQPQNEEQLDYEERHIDSPHHKVKTVLRTPNVIRHVYGAPPPSDEVSPTIPPRYLKDMPLSSSSGEKYRSPLQSLPPVSEIISPVKDLSDNYNEHIVKHKYVNLGDVYRKATNEEEIVKQEEVSSGEDTLEGYAKDPYDKQLVNTLKNLMASSKERHPLNIGGLTETDNKDEDNYKSRTKTVKSIDSFFHKSTTDQYSSQPLTYTQDDSFSQSLAQRLPIPQSLFQYSSPSQASSQSKIPESLLSPLSPAKIFSSNGYSTQSLSEKIPASNGGSNMIQLLPGQIPVLPDLSTNRRPVAIDFDYNTGARPLSPSSYFSEDQKLGAFGQTKTYITNAEQIAQSSYQSPQSSYQSPQQPLKTYVVTGLYRKQIGGQDKNVDQVEQYDDKVSLSKTIRSLI